LPQKPKTKQPQTAQKRFAPLIAALAVLTAAIFAVYWQTKDFGFISMDDDVYVTQNPYVPKGISSEGMSWAFSADDWQARAANWYPVTWLSLMLDGQIGGARSSTFHITNVILHAVNSALLLILLLRLTGAFWPSVLASALFGLHPLHVESVAWISSRKDLVSALFWFLSLLAYERYARKPTKTAYLAAALAAALGLMAKPVTVTLPFTLLLLDFWPLRREGLQRILKEKIPFFILSAALAAATIWAQRGAGAVSKVAELSLRARLLNAVTSYGAYVGKALWPRDLAIFYPHPGLDIATAKVAAALLFLAAASWFCWRERKSRPYLLFGWLWYLITMLPMIGVIQVGGQAMADRYTYVPLVGLFIAAAWWLAETKTVPAAFKTAAAILAIGTFSGLSFVQAGYWRDDATVWRRALTVTRDNSVAHYNLARELMDRGQISEAVQHFQSAVRIDPDHADAYSALASMHLNSGRLAEAREYLAKTLAVDDGNVEANANMAVILTRERNYPQAFAYYEKALLRGERTQEIRHLYEMTRRQASQDQVPRR
jgi:tetratricopeptide (TPR) repeat protein